MKEIFSQISIKGRLLFCLACLKNAFSQYKLENAESQLVLDVIGKYVLVESVSEWEEMAEDILPSNLLDSKFNVKDFNFLGHNMVLQLKLFYEECPKDIVSIIELTTSVGLNNLYGGTGLDSPLTLEPTLEVIALCMKNNIELPSVSDYQVYRFDINHGWG